MPGDVILRKAKRAEDAGIRYEVMEEVLNKAVLNDAGEKHPEGCEEAAQKGDCVIA
jgi:hypothetical protein